ncbi:MAG: helix-turn-helix domain-containing protein [Ilumatobacteraceae bacterium]|nr:helix-turn-helix domain-containing protein [Ilumatobacteraceae bacterium]
MSNKIKRDKNHKNEASVFDAVRFAQLLSHRRQQLGLTTRQLAMRANISQPYVVALERSRNGVHATKTSAMSPSPTVDMIARLATALQMSANDLFIQAVRPAGKHVLLFMEDDMVTSLERARTASTKSATATDKTPQKWLCAGGPVAHDTLKSHNCLSINLHRDSNNAYKPKAITASLSNELSRHQANISGSDIGIVFDETSSLMNHVNNPMSIVEFEHDWKQVVTDATQAVGAFAAWNICVYRIDNLLSLHNPAEVAQDLLRSHDNVWSARNKSITTGTSAAKRLLTLVRPQDVSAKSWSAHTNAVVQELQISA